MSLNAVLPLFAQPHRFNTLLQHDLLRWVSEALVGQSPSMRLRPSRPAIAIDPLVTQQKRTQLLARGAHRAHGRLPGADQIAHRLVCRVRHPDCGQQSASVQHRQAGGVAFVVLLPLAAFAWDHRGGDDHAILPQQGYGVRTSANRFP
jgi:hypothetical protein